MGNMVGLLDIRFERIGDDTLEATKIAIDHRANSRSKLAAWRSVCGAGGKYRLRSQVICVYTGEQVVGLEVNANHVRSARQGRVRGVCKRCIPGLGIRSRQMKMFDEQGRLCCSSLLTTAIV